MLDQGGGPPITLLRFLLILCLDQRGGAGRDLGLISHRFAGLPQRLLSVLPLRFLLHRVPLHEGACLAQATARFSQIGTFLEERVLGVLDLPRRLAHVPAPIHETVHVSAPDIVLLRVAIPPAISRRCSHQAPLVQRLLPGAETFFDFRRSDRDTHARRRARKWHDGPVNIFHGLLHPRVNH